MKGIDFDGRPASEMPTSIFNFYVRVSETVFLTTLNDMIIEEIEKQVKKLAKDKFRKLIKEHVAKNIDSLLLQLDDKSKK